MKNKLIICFGLLSVLLACKTKEKTKNNEYITAEKTDCEQLNLTEGLSYYILFQSGDTILAPNGKLVKSKENLDCNILIPKVPSPKSDNYKEAKLFVGFETRYFDTDLGAGGGGMLLELKKTASENNWTVNKYPKSIDYKRVGETINNCGGKINPNTGLIYSAEEYYPTSKQELYPILQDTADYKNKSIVENFGWIVEIDPNTGKAIRKMTQFGRFCHEDILFAPDGKTVFLTNDEAPAVLFKFVAAKPNDFSVGKLFGYSEAKKWIELPNDYQSLLNIKNVAFSKGATAFTRHEWLTLVGKTLYITETGKDYSSYRQAVKMGAAMPSYYKSDSIIDDPYGRILALDIETNELKVVLEGGKYGEFFFSNPDCITSYTKNGKSYLIINEDIIALDRNRSDFDFYQNEVYRYDLQTKKIARILIAPKGSETTGGIFDGEGNYFVNIQHPDIYNKSIFNRSSLVVIKGIQE